jgi:hypothetical protein
LLLLWRSQMVECFVAPFVVRRPCDAPPCVPYHRRLRPSTYVEFHGCGAVTRTSHADIAEKGNERKNPWGSDVTSTRADTRAPAMLLEDDRSKAGG